MEEIQFLEIFLLLEAAEAGLERFPRRVIPVIMAVLAAVEQQVVQLVAQEVHLFPHKDSMVVKVAVVLAQEAVAVVVLELLEQMELLFLLAQAGMVC